MFRLQVACGIKRKNGAAASNKMAIIAFIGTFVCKMCCVDNLTCRLDIYQ